MVIALNMDSRGGVDSCSWMNGLVAAHPSPSEVKLVASRPV